MDVSLRSVVGHLPCRCTDPIVPFALHRSTSPCLGGKEDQNIEDKNGALQWLFEDPTPGASTIDFIYSLPLAKANPGKAAPALSGVPQRLPGDLAACVNARPRDVFDALCGFFRGGVPAVIEEERPEALELTATAFLDYAATHAKAFVLTSTGPDSGSTLVFRHTSQDDIVHFHSLFSAAVKHLREAKRWQVDSLGGIGLGGGGCGGFEDEDFFDDDDELEQDWGARVESAVETVASLNVLERRQGLQALATWAESRPDACPAIARSLSTRPELTRMLLGAPVAELYPFAVVLKFVAAQGCATIEGLAEQILPMMLTPGLPPIVANELHTTCKDLLDHAGDLFRSQGV